MRLSGDAVLKETAKLHESDPENLAALETISSGVPCGNRSHLRPTRNCLRRTARRVSITTDLVTWSRNSPNAGLATTSNGATVIFLDGFETPFLIRKRTERFCTPRAIWRRSGIGWRSGSPDSILYVVDHRQSLHFEQLFAAAQRMLGTRKCRVAAHGMSAQCLAMMENLSKRDPATRWD